MWSIRRQFHFHFQSHQTDSKYSTEERHSLNNTTMNQQFAHVNLKLRKVTEVGILIQLMSKNGNRDVRIQLGHSAGTCQCPDTT